MRLILARLFQVDKNGAQILVVYFWCNILIVILFCQAKTETGSAGEQPVRDKLDKTDEKSKKRELSVNG